MSSRENTNVLLTIWTETYSIEKLYNATPIKRIVLGLIAITLQAIVTSKLARTSSARLDGRFNDFFPTLEAFLHKPGTSGSVVIQNDFRASSVRLVAEPSPRHTYIRRLKIESKTQTSLE